MTTEPKWKVGDRVVVVKPRYSHHSEPSVEYTTVDRVARKYFYVGKVKGRWDEEGYEIATGIEKPHDSNYTNNLGHAYTPAEYTEKQIRDALFEQIRKYSKLSDTQISFSSWSGRKKWKTERLQDLAAVLQLVVADDVEVHLDTY